MSFPAAIDLRRVRPTGSRRAKSAPASGAGRSRFVLAGAVLILAAVLVASWWLVRSSSLVAVEQVKVEGLSGYYEKDARKAVVAAAMAMTTMDFDEARIEQAAAEFVDVAGVEVETDFPHTATITVDVRRPVVVARVGGRTVTLSQTGQVMIPEHAVAGLPKIDVPGVIDGDHVTSGRAHQAVRVLGAAPDVLLRKVETIKWGKLGIVVKLEGGPELYFGASSDARAKWADAAAVLASSQSRGAAYLDLRVPGRVAIGGLGGAAQPETSVASVSGVATPQSAPQSITSTPAPAASTPQATTQAPASAPAPAQPSTPSATTPAAGGAAPGM